MSGLAQFLAARLDEDAEDSWDKHEGGCATAGPIAFSCDCGYPARVLREVEAKRKILAEHEPQPWGEPHPELSRCPAHGDETSGWWTEWPCVEVRALAAVWSDHPDYDEAWKP